MKSTIRRCALAATVAACAAAALAAPADAAVSAAKAKALVASQSDPLAAPDLGPGWVGTPAGYALADVVHRTVQGVRDASGACQFDTAVSATKARPAVLGRSRAIDESRCLAIVEVGAPPADVVARYDAERAELNPGAGDATSIVEEEVPNQADVTDEVTPDVGAGEPTHTGVHGDASVATVCPPGSCRRADVTSLTGYYRTWFEDPVNIDVNSLRQELYWSTEGARGCVRSDYSTLSPNHFEQSGWYRNGTNRRAGRTCSRAFTSAYGKFTNPVFCRVVTAISPIPIPGESLISPTRTYYNRAVARGFNTGKLTGTTRWSKKGGCSSLLSFNHIARHY